MNVQQALAARISANKFDTAHELAPEEVEALVAAAMEAPSAYNIQHARFLVVREPAARAALQQVAYGQQKVRDAAATFVVLGDTRGAERLPLIAERRARPGCSMRPARPVSRRRGRVPTQASRHSPATRRSARPAWRRWR